MGNDCEQPRVQNLQMLLSWVNTELIIGQP